MTPQDVKRIRTNAGLSIRKLMAVLRIRDRKTPMRWESGDVPVSGPASILLEMIEADELPHRYYDQENVK